MKEIVAQKILAESKSNYDLIAKTWDQTRKNIWPEMNDFKNYLKSGDRILDAGCGNGRLVKALEGLDVKYVGVDNSSELVALAKSNFLGYDFFVSDFLKTDFADNSFDAIFCLAALHHIPSGQKRNQAIGEFKRLLKPGGNLFMLNWHYSCPGFAMLFLRYTLSKILGKSELDFGDIYVSWQKNKIKRFVHLFSKYGLKKMLKKNGFKTERNFISKPSPRGYKNIVTIAKRSKN